MTRRPITIQEAIRMADETMARAEQGRLDAAEREAAIPACWERPEPDHEPMKPTDED